MISSPKPDLATLNIQPPKAGSRVAVVGSGISALSAAWFLSQQHDVTVFEKQDRLGGHTNTIEVDESGKKVNVDTGFIVFNSPNYPNLTAMFDHLNVKTKDTDMSFAVSINQGELEYSGTDLNGLFAQRSNLFSYSHWSMIFEILRFNKQAKKDLQSTEPLDLSLEEYLNGHKFSDKMRNHYLLPMAAAIWSCPVETMLLFPARSFLQFFENHGLLNVEDRPQWETVVNGSKTYIAEILKDGNFTIRLNSPVIKVNKQDNKVLLTTADGSETLFDEVVFGSHADETYAILDDKLKAKFSVLENFSYQENIAYLHTDKDLMPTRKLAWSSWNYLRDMSRPETSVAVSYWMNLLQNLKCEEDYFVTLNPIQKPAVDKTIKEIIYQHPVFDQKAMDSQPDLYRAQGQDGIWMCGSYFGYGFHEDGLTSSVDLAKLWHITLPWSTPTTHDLSKTDTDIKHTASNHEVSRIANEDTISLSQPTRKAS